MNSKMRQVNMLAKNPRVAFVREPLARYRDKVLLAWAAGNYNTTHSHSFSKTSRQVLYYSLEVLSSKEALYGKEVLSSNTATT